MQAFQPPSIRPIITWSDALLVGHALIDADHCRLFEIAERVHRGIREAGADLLVRGVLDELVDYSFTHFEREEALMKEVGFPGLEEHRFEHELISYRLRNLQRQILGGRDGLAGELEIFLDRWLARHILTSDAQFAATLRDRQARGDAG